MRFGNGALLKWSAQWKMLSEISSPRSMNRGLEDSKAGGCGAAQGRSNITGMCSSPSACGAVYFFLLKACCIVLLQCRQAGSFL